ncbi:MAG: hypothetical protein QXW16_01670 [Saccharolobus sp.]
MNRTAFKYSDKPYTDSYLILEEIKDEIERGNTTPYDAFSKTIDKLKDYASSLNSTLISFNRSEGTSILVAYYYNKNRLDRESKEEYYKLYTDNNGYIFSSTVKYYLNINSEELTFGSITHL